jgi:hypothetical protein
MSRIEKFKQFTNEGFDSFMSKQRRIVTGASAGDEIHKLSEEQQQELIELYVQNPNEAAKYLRSIIVKEKNKQFGLGLALAVAGATMVYKAMNVDPPKPPPHPDPNPDPTPDPTPEPTPSDDYIVQKGDSWWKIAKDNLPAGSSNKQILTYAKQIASENGAEHLYSGKFGSPGLKPDNWSDLVSGQQDVSKSLITGEDRLFPGEVIKINPFGGKIIPPTID